MAINRNYTKKYRKLTWDGEELGTVRALNADDIGEIMVSVGAAVVDLLTLIGEVEFGTTKNAQKLADNILQNAPQLVAKISNALPDLMALVICRAGEDPDAVDAVAQWPMPMQVEAMAEIFRLTFVDDEGFRKFVGNALALLQSGNALTSSADNRSKTKTEAVQQSLADG